MKDKVLELNLLDKNEIRMENLRLEKVNLNDVAAAISDVLELRRDEVIVTDVGESSITVDILRRKVHAEQICSKKDELLKKLSTVSGISVTEETDIHSEGILGLIAFDEESAKRAIECSKKMGEEIKQKISRRSMVFSSGEEIRRGMVEDTNTPMIVKRLESEGYKVKRGPTIGDDEGDITQYISPEAWELKRKTEPSKLYKK